MKMNRLFFLLLVLVLIIWQCGTEKSIHIYLIGDSTMANKSLQDNPERGWGQLFPEYFNKNVRIHNHARNGRSTKSFIDEMLWKAVYDSLQAGDYLFIQFGHNDQKKYDSTRYADPHGAYKRNLEKFIKESRSKNAIPVLLTPVMRRRFDEQGKFYDVHGDYPGVVREIAKQKNVPLIDLHQSSKKLIVDLGVEGSKKIFLWVEPGKYARFPGGKQDNTHFTEYGARKVAGLVAKQLNELKLPLKNYLLDKENCK